MSLIACEVINFNPSLFHNIFIFIVNLIRITAEQFEIRSKAQLDARVGFKCEILSKERFYYYSGNLFHAIKLKYSGSSESFSLFFRLRFHFYSKQRNLEHLILKE